jgi:hypothetical protein
VPLRPRSSKAAVAWRGDESLYGVDFRRDILPKLQRLPMRVIAEAMGASLSHGSKVRGGKLVPHKRHWESLGALNLRISRLSRRSSEAKTRLISLSTILPHGGALLATFPPSQRP